jgi:septal ring factor EnvC (AmiA/AmiB activator)
MKRRSIFAAHGHPTVGALAVGLLLTAVSSCAYQRYMDEERVRQTSLNSQLRQEKVTKRGLEARSSELEVSREKKRRELQKSKTLLAAKREQLRGLPPVASISNAPNREKIAAENRRLQSDIATLESDIAARQQEFDALTH